MQHIATPKTDAAATLPIDFNSTISIESSNDTGSDKNELVFASLLSEAGDIKQNSGDTVIDKGRTTPVEPEPATESFARTDLNTEPQKEELDIDWVAFVDDVISGGEYNDTIVEQVTQDNGTDISSIISSEIEGELAEDDEGHIVVVENELATENLDFPIKVEVNFDEELQLSSLDSENEAPNELENNKLVDEDIQFQIEQDGLIEEFESDNIEGEELGSAAIFKGNNDEIAIGNSEIFSTDVLFDEVSESEESTILEPQDDVLLTAASQVVAIINAIGETRENADLGKLKEADVNLNSELAADPILAEEQFEADVELVTTLLESELEEIIDELNLTPANNDTIPVIAPPSVNIDENTPIESELVSLSDDDIEAVVQNVLTVLPESVDKANLSVSLRADIVASVSDVKALINNGQSTEQSLTSIVEQSLSSDAIELTDEQTSLVLQQTAKAEQFLGLVQNVVEQANGQVSVAAQLLSSAAPTSHTNDVSLATTFDNLTAEGAIDVATQNRAQTQVQVANDLERAVPIHQAEGQKQIAEKIRWMVGGRVTAAEIRLDPPELGSMQIRINMVGDTASVNFVVQSAQARDVLAQTEPQLRDMLSEQGLDLGESFVSTQDGEGSDGENGDGSANNPLFASESDDDIDVIEQPIRPNQSPYNVDAYV